MHIVVSWDINSPASNNHTYWNDKMVEVLKPYAWIRPLNTFYIVPIKTTLDLTAINNGLTQIANQTGGVIHFVISPPMVGGQYSGVLPTELWPEIKRRSAM